MDATSRTTEGGLIMPKGCYNCKHDTPTGHPCSTCLSTYGKDVPPTNWEAAENYEPSTNADRIRAMTDEELAEWILDGVSCDPCDYCKYSSVHCISYQCKSDEETILDWLRQPVKED